jgi:16S rRNA U516 pseudouridylate synthase RsuA-like enzyme
MKKADIKLWIETLEKIVSACDMTIDKAKATRKPRVKKAPSKEKLIAKIKYCKEDTKLSLVSANPLELIDAKEVWVYNVKTRKLGKYVADEHATIQVKGTTLQFYDEKNSIQKTLRKPDETLKEFKKAGKVALRKFMDNIKTTDIKLNGRLNSDTIILKCIH